jgi:guanyl-specific ribonuclease Sa
MRNGRLSNSSCAAEVTTVASSRSPGAPAAHEHDKRLADRDKGKRGDLLAEKKQAIWKQERRGGHGREAAGGVAVRRPLGRA